MKLSIITVNYNNLEGLKKTLDSVKAQTFKDYEWIVIDGGSTDGSKELLESHDGDISYWVSERDNGIYHAMNKGIMQAHGKFCQFLNSGDYYISPDTLSKVFSLGDLSDVNYGDQWCIENGKVTERRTYPDKMSLDYLFNAPLGHQATFFRTSAIKAHPYRENYTISSDRALFLELYTSGCHFRHLPQPIVYFDTLGIGSSAKTFATRKQQFHDIKREYFADQVVCDIERLMRDSENYQFVQRNFPLRWTYNLFRSLQRLRDKLR